MSSRATTPTTTCLSDVRAAMHSVLLTAMLLTATAGAAAQEPPVPALLEPRRESPPRE